MCLGTVGTVVDVWIEAGVPMARIGTPSGVETACLLAAPEVRAGAGVLVHMGFVVEVLGPGAAEDALELRTAAPDQEERS
jgi:hydrogenase maturation factor